VKAATGVRVAIVVIAAGMGVTAIAARAATVDLATTGARAASVGIVIAAPAVSAKAAVTIRAPRPTSLRRS
jgi:hypothetical protein